MLCSPSVRYVDSEHTYSYRVNIYVASNSAISSRRVSILGRLLSICWRSYKYDLADILSMPCLPSTYNTPRSSKYRPDRTLVCLSRTPHARSPQRVARMHPTDRTLACVSCTRHARSPQRVAGAQDKSHSCLHFTYSTRTISAQSCAHMGHIALSPAFRALNTHDLRRGLPAHVTHRTLACISRTRHARSPQRVAHAQNPSHSRLHFARSTRTISAEGCPRT